VTRAILACLLILAGCRAAGPKNLDSIDPLRDWFNAHDGRARFVALLSPT
jgi:hypothetical protein